MPSVRPITKDKISKILAFETLSSTEWNAQLSKNVFLPNYFVPLEEEIIHKKIEALSFYSSEFRGFPHPRSIEAVKTLARFRGIMCGHEYAEAFSLVREIESQ
jgi:hypothetical protein